MAMAMVMAMGEENDDSKAAAAEPKNPIRLSCVVLLN